MLVLRGFHPNTMEVNGVESVVLTLLKNDIFSNIFISRNGVPVTQRTINITHYFSRSRSKAEVGPLKPSYLSVRYLLSRGTWTLFLERHLLNSFSMLWTPQTKFPSPPFYWAGGRNFRDKQNICMVDKWQMIKYLFCHLDELIL